MDYSNKGILVMLQDLQRINYGKITMHVSLFLMEESGPLVNGTVFDKNDEPHNFNFYSFDSDEKHKEEYQKLLELVNETTA